MSFKPTAEMLRGLQAAREMLHEGFVLEHLERPLTSEESRKVEVAQVLRKVAPYLGDDGLTPMTDEAWKTGADK